MFKTWSLREFVQRFLASSNGLRAAPVVVNRRRPALRVEPLEDRLLLDAGWSGYAHDPQHTAISTVASQSLDLVGWQTPVDLNPQYSGGDLFIHYGSPLVTPNNTVIVPVKTGATGGFRLEGHNGQDGTLVWTQPTDYLLPPHNWTPSFSPAFTPTNQLYYQGAGGTVYVIDNADLPGSAPTHLAFYGIESYNPTTFDSHVYINTPITADNNGNIYFGFQTVGTAPLNLHSGIARIDSAGNGTWIAASDAATDPAISKVVQNNAPALSNDGSTLYVAVNDVSGAGYLLGLDSTTLQPLAKVRLKDPRVAGRDAILADDGTASPTVGPDGDVYFGVLENPVQSSKGWLLHFSGDLSQTLSPPGGFGWDDTASIVASSLVPSYQGASTYLLMTKYNNYAGLGGDGVNKIAILDPNDTEIDPRTQFPVMKEVISIAGQTPDPEFIATHPGAVREWCINTAAVDPFTDSILANAEDGRLYRWDLSTNTFSQIISLTTATGEAYTPTVIGVDGTVYAVNNATLFAVKAFPGPRVVSAAPNSAVPGQTYSLHVVFNEAIDLSSFTTAAFTLTGPDGGHPAFGVAPVAGSSFSQFDVLFVPLTAAGSYSVAIGPNVRDEYGNPMHEAFTTTFVIASPGVTGATPGTARPVDRVLVTFDRPIAPSTFSIDSFALADPDGSSIAITDVTPVPFTNDTQLEVDFAPSSALGRYTLTVRAGVADIYGNALGDDLSTDFTL
jgi:hypothetical protein